MYTPMLYFLLTISWYFNIIIIGYNKYLLNTNYGRRLIYMAKKVVITGGVAGGATAAARIRRLDEEAEIIIFEKGEYISFANCGLPYHIGGVIKDRSRLLLQSPETMKSRYNIDVRIRSEVTAIFP